MVLLSIIILLGVACSARAQNDLDFHIYDQDNHEKISGWIISSMHNEFLISDEMRLRAQDLAQYDSLKIYKFGYHLLDVAANEIHDSLYLHKLSQTIDPVEISADKLKKKTLKKSGSIFNTKYQFTPFSSTLFQLTVSPRPNNYLLKSIQHNLKLSRCEITEEKLYIISGDHVLMELISIPSNSTISRFDDINIEIKKLQSVEIYYQIKVDNPGECKVSFNTVNDKFTSHSKSIIYSSTIIENVGFPYHIVIKE